MPAGKPWFDQRPTFRKLPSAQPFWHVYAEQYGPLAANPKSEGRLALTGTHGMFYAADSLAGALWETVLRYVTPDASRRVSLLADKLAGMRAVQVVLLRDDVNLLPLGQPELRDMFAIDSAEAREVAAILHDPEHRNTHSAGRRLRDDLNRVGIAEMPVLSWPSRQLSSATVYLAYAPPMDGSWWQVNGTPIRLDDPVSGHQALHQALAPHGFVWTPLATSATPPGPD